MFGSSKKRSRLDLWKQQARAARQGTPDERSRRRRAYVCRIALAIGTVVAITFVAHAGGGHWGPPFSFREGEVYPRDIRVKVDFSIVDEPATQLKREQAAASVHPILTLDPAPLKELEHRLTQLCLAGRSRQLELLDPEMIRFWALSDEDLKTLEQLLRGGPDSPASFTLFMSPRWSFFPDGPVLDAVASSKARYAIVDEADIRSRIHTAFQTLITNGILEDKEKELPEALRVATKFSIRRSGSEPRVDLLPDQVVKSKLVGDPKGERGQIYLQFSQAFKNEKLAEYLYLLVVGTDKRPSRLPATLTYDPAATEEARQHASASIAEQRKVYKRGTPLIEQGKPITDQDLPVLREEHKAYLASLTWKDHLRRWFSLFLIISMLAGFVGLHIWQSMPGLAESVPRLLGFCMLVTAGLWAGVYLNESPWYGVIIPLTMTAMIMTMAYNQTFAWIVSFCMALTLTLSLGTDLARHFLVLVSGMTVAVLLLRTVRTRSQLTQVGLAAGVAYAVMTLSVGFLTDQSWSLIGEDAVRRFFWGLVAGLFLTGLLPVIERLYGIVTDMSLLELADVSHPLLQEMIRRAPGTYSHSMTVALLAEAAAKAIGANPLLTRVGASFHDIGKMLKPHYFVENQTSGENRHEGLAPAMSTLIIIGHVKDGVELAKQHRLPQPVIDFIEQHHGTTLVEYFYHEALRALEGNGNGQHSELEASFRYPGPKPQSREIGVVMLADAVEGASRALNEPAPSTIRKLVHEILLKRLLDGQFDESGLTLSDLHIIEESLCINLIALYHARVKYPEGKDSKVEAPK